ncbi:hypothetical protein K9O30_20030 [Clostridium bowmanii]|uniref:hypothetical protein n=1 Tax=Clostridium bowmanii TaxID=132925 RepID=UPI001C0D8A63|nr:hypothetical protein [Clostridium bowmanii]MBU3191794.1 hypothetical protein [Clostridium bowmanii]MCA1075967.1 hypothetical protein [Clostridium bowmanii]
MVKTYKTLILICILVFSFYINCEAKDYSNFNDLIENSKSIDKDKIILKGEAIGEAMNRGKYSWVNISDGNTAMGIWLESEQEKSIKNLGKYGYKGDTVEVVGIFNRACIEHGGDMDVHALSIKVIDVGGKVIIPISKNKKNIAILLTLITLALILTYIKFAKSTSK